jgi:hypothetical protein
VGGVSVVHEDPVSVETSIAGPGEELCDPTATQNALVSHEMAPT